MRLYFLPVFALALFLGASALSAQTHPAASQPAKDPVPDAASVKSALATVTGAFKDEIAAAKTIETMHALLLKMLKTADDEKGVNRYAIIIKTRDLASDNGDVTACELALDTLDANFAVDILKLRSDACMALVRNVGVPESRKSLLQFMSKVVHSALFADRFDIARTISATATAGSQSVADPVLVQIAVLDSRSVGECQAAFNDIKPVVAILADKPDDPVATLKVGKYRCYIKDDWHSGLPLLATSGDAAMKKLAALDILAEQDLAIDKELPLSTTTDDQVKLGDSWWDLAEKEKGVAQRNVRQHAANWYWTALPGLTGLGKARVTERLATDKTLVKPLPRPVPLRNFAGRWVETNKASQAFVLSMDGTSYSESDKNTGHWTVNPEGTLIKIVWENGGWSDTYRHYDKQRWLKQAFKDGKPYTSAILTQPGPAAP